MIELIRLMDDERNMLRPFYAIRLRPSSLMREGWKGGLSFLNHLPGPIALILSDVLLKIGWLKAVLKHTQSRRFAWNHT